MELTRRGFGAVAVLGLLGTLASPSASGADPAALLSQQFQQYGDSSGQWSGGDSTASVDLGDGRTVWLFSDTFLGPVAEDHTRPRSSAFVNNSLVLEESGLLTATLHGGTPEQPASLVSAVPGEMYWVGDALASDGELRVLYNRYRKTGDGSFDFALLGTALATFDLATLAPRGVLDLPLGATTAWGSAVVTEGGQTYVFGSQVTADGAKIARLARVPSGALAEPWQFWTGSDWSPSEDDATGLVRGVGTAFGVQRIGGRVVLVTQDTRYGLDSGIVAYPADELTGPYGDPVPLFRAPEPGPGNAFFAYDARLHPERARAGTLFVSYNLNSVNPDDNYSDARIYRPRFVEVPWPTATL